MQNLHITVSVKFSFFENICNVAGYDRLVLLKPSSISCRIIIAREFIISGFRLIAAEDRKSVV